MVSHPGEMEEYKVTAKSLVAKDCFQTIQRHQEPVTMTHNMNTKKYQREIRQMNKQVLEVVLNCKPHFPP